MPENYLSGGVSMPGTGGQLRWNEGSGCAGVYMEEENSRLKRIVADMTLQIDAFKHVYEKKYGGLPKG